MVRRRAGGHGWGEAERRGVAGHIKVRAGQVSTWRGLALLGAVAGVYFFPALAKDFIMIAASAVGLVDVVRKDK